MYKVNENEKKYLKEIEINVNELVKEDDENEFDKLVDYICDCEVSDNFDEEIAKTEKYQTLCNFYERILND